MTAVAHLSALYSAAKIILWVEDAVTRDYLTKIWGDPPEIAFLIAGNSDAVAPTVVTARQAGNSHVFGLIDRDFRTTNSANWNAPATQIFRLPRHEIENYLLDAPAIHGCILHNRARSVAEITTELNRLAGEQPAWLACRQIMSKMRTELLSDFPAHPRLIDITTTAQVEQYIITSLWFTQLTGRATTWTTTGHVLSEAQIAEAANLTTLGNGTWAIEFSGKEIFRPLRSYVYQPRTAGDHDSDFAKAIGEWQNANAQIPADLIQLRSVLRVKVGLPP